MLNPAAALASAPFMFMLAPGLVPIAIRGLFSRSRPAILVVPLPAVRHVDAVTDSFDDACVPAPPALPPMAMPDMAPLADSAVAAG